MNKMQEHLQTVADHLNGAFDESLPPSFKSAEMAAVLDSLSALTSPNDPQAPARLGLMVAELLSTRLMRSMAAEREAKLAIKQHGLH